MIFEVRKGRSCDTLRTLQADVITKQQTEILAQGIAIDLQTHQIENYRALDKTWQERFDNSEALHKQKEKQARKKGRLQGLVTGALAVVAVVLLL